MKRILVIFAIFLSMTNLFAESVEENVLEASNTMKKLIRSQNGIPMPIIKDAQAIVVVPGSVKFGFFVGGKYGEGVATIRKADGSWSYPFFIKLGGGSLGFQFGFEVVDSILVFRTKNSVDELLSDKFTLGVEASASAGPISANTDKSSEVNMSAEIFTYSQNSGLFAGAILNGAVISNNEEKNRALYGNSVSVKKIVTSENLSDAYSVKEFLKNLNNLTER
jgi:lipid-binding SYLF domain-containing protein